MKSRLLCVVLLTLLGCVAACAADNDSTGSDSARTINVRSQRSPGAIGQMGDVELGIIYAAKKTERVHLRDFVSNTSTNLAREALSTVAGLNIWESDGGLQLGVGGRGLSPNRTTHFSTRQNGYDISADPLGYPESYYTPPLDFVDRIDFVRGAGSLRYGTQFGGTINFIMHKSPYNDPFSLRIKTSAGSYDTYSGLAEVTARTSTFGLIAAVQTRRSLGWRPNSCYDVITGYAAVDVTLDTNLWLFVDYTNMAYDAQQPGGLTDVAFEQDPSQSFRSRNWFSVDWNLASVRLLWQMNAHTTLQSATFGNLSSRKALGNLDRINIIDLGAERTMISGDFTNIGNETVLQQETHVMALPLVWIAGVRLFHGMTTQLQGDASAGSEADYTYSRPDRLQGSDYVFPNSNVALFFESVLSVTDRLSLVPGVRVEYISTKADGYYALRQKDFAGNVILDSLIYENRARERSFAIAGFGVKYSINDAKDLELYANYSRNYRSITFSDLRVVNANIRVDPDIADEKGFNADLGIRGAIGSWLVVDANVFYLRYNNKIGEVLKSDIAPLFLPYRYRTNVSQAYTQGIEAVLDADILSMIGDFSYGRALHIISNIAFVEGHYVGSQDASVRDKHVEFVPPYTIRNSLRAEYNGIRVTFTHALVGEHYTDASNATYTASAISGIIPAYQVADASMSYTIGSLTLTLNCNNVFNTKYFTRRAESYPGPGIIPADPRMFTLAAEYRF